MRLTVTHRMLAMAPDMARAEAHVLRFLDRTQLVRYDAAQVVTAESCGAMDSRFWPWVEEGISGNRQVLNKLLSELRAAGTREFSDLPSLPQGFQSKILHTMAHLLDGFFGIDSQFYCLPEDSHWVGPGLRKQIKATPEDFWLITVEATLGELGPGTVAALRLFEK